MGADGREPAIAQLSEPELDTLEQLRSKGDRKALHERLKSLGFATLGARLRADACLQHRSEASAALRTTPPTAPPFSPTIASSGAPSALHIMPPPPPSVIDTNDTDLSAEQCTSLLQDLLRKYAEPEFRAMLDETQRSLKGPAESGLSEPIWAHLAPRLLRVQAPVLAKYGLPPSPTGVELMKFAIHRRIAEGATELQPLANEARRVLGLQPLPKTRMQRVEDLLAQMAEITSHADAISRRTEITSHADAISCRTEITSRIDTINRVHPIGGRPKACGAVHVALDAKLQAARTSGKLAPPATALLESIVAHLSPSLASCLVAMATAGLPVAALRSVAAADVSTDPLRAPSRALHEVHVLHSLPTAAAFFTAHVLPSLPAVLRGVVNAQTFPPMANFPNLGYLRRRCAHRRVPVKSLALEDQEGRPVFVSEPSLDDRGDLLDSLISLISTDLHRSPPSPQVSDPEIKMPLVGFLSAVEESEASGKRCPFYLGKVGLHTDDYR
jgi:hypothetical protein